MFWRFEDSEENLKTVVIESEKEYIDHRNTARLVSRVQGPAVGSEFDFMYLNPSAYSVNVPHHWQLRPGGGKVVSRND